MIRKRAVTDTVNPPGQVRTLGDYIKRIQQADSAELNQCDGCMSKHSVNEYGNHWTLRRGVPAPYMACQRHQYEKKT